MTFNTQFQQLNSGLKELQTAIFKDCSNALLKFPACIIQLYSIDKEGRLLFLLKKPYTYTAAYKQWFPSQLQFYNKKCDYYITAVGKATLIKDISPDKVMISFRITTAAWHSRGKAKLAGYVADMIYGLFWNNKGYQVLSFT